MDNSSQTIPTNATTQIHTQGLAMHTKVVLYSVPLVCALVGNILVIAVVIGNKNLRTAFNYSIVNMAVSDLIIPILALPLRITDEVTNGKWHVDGPFGNALCKLCFFLADTSPIVSVLSLLLITAERFVIIVYPMKKHYFENKKCCILIACIWITASALASPIFYIFRLENKHGVRVCNPNRSPSFDNSMFIDIYLLILALVTFVIPIVVMIILYPIIIHKINQTSKDVAKCLTDSQISARKRRDRHFFYLSIIIVFAFCVLWGPFFCSMFLVNYFSVGDKTSAFIVQYLGFLNSAVNPCIYFIFLKNFKQGLRNICLNIF